MDMIKFLHQAPQEFALKIETPSVYAIIDIDNVIYLVPKDVALVSSQLGFSSKLIGYIDASYRDAYPITAIKVHKYLYQYWYNAVNQNCYAYLLACIQMILVNHQQTYNGRKNMLEVYEPIQKHVLYLFQHIIEAIADYEAYPNREILVKWYQKIVRQYDVSVKFFDMLYEQALQQYEEKESIDNRFDAQFWESELVGIL